MRAIVTEPTERASEPDWGPPLPASSDPEPPPLSPEPEVAAVLVPLVLAREAVDAELPEVAEVEEPLEVVVLANVPEIE